MTENLNSSYFDLEGSIFDDLTIDRELSTRSIDLRCWFDLIKSRAFEIKFQQKASNWKAESQANLISKTRASEDASIWGCEILEIRKKAGFPWKIMGQNSWGQFTSMNNFYFYQLSIQIFKNHASLRWPLLRLSGFPSLLLKHGQQQKLFSSQLVQVPVCEAGGRRFRSRKGIP